MEKNTLYEILEVSEKASQEIIEKAYKTLAKKYHPDLQGEADKQNAEAMMKKINEAYEVLSNEEKRKAYDTELQIKRQEIEQINASKDGKIEQNNNFVNYEPKSSDFSNSEDFDYEKERQKYERRLQKEEYKQRRKMEENLNKEYQNAYENYLRDLGYRVKHKWTKENFRDFFMVIGIMILIFIILWIIPPSREWMQNFYNSNPILKSIVDVLVGVIKGIFNGIWSFITGLFN